jgi:hypothetical protein
VPTTFEVVAASERPLLKLTGQASGGSSGSSKANDRGNYTFDAANAAAPPVTRRRASGRFDGGDQSEARRG